MSDWSDMNYETRSDRMARKERAEWINSGPRGSDGLTARETALLNEIRSQGLVVRHGDMVSRRTHKTYPHDRMIVYA